MKDIRVRLYFDESSRYWNCYRYWADAAGDGVLCYNETVEYVDVPIRNDEIVLVLSARRSEDSYYLMIMDDQLQVATDGMIETPNSFEEFRRLIQSACETFGTEGVWASIELPCEGDE